MTSSRQKTHNNMDLNVNLNISDMANISTDCEEMLQYLTIEDVQRICRVCLKTNSKELAPLMSLENDGLTNMFTSLTSIHVSQKSTHQQL